MACTWWCVFDWYRMSSSLQTMGLYTMNRDVAKPVAAVLKAAYLPYYNMDGVLTNVENENHSLVEKFELIQNYPNPFNPITKLKFSIPTLPFNSSLHQEEGNRERFVTLKVYDVLGNIVATLVDEEKAAGNYEIEFDASKLSSGVYFYQLKSGALVSSKKMVLLK